MNQDDQESDQQALEELTLLLISMTTWTEDMHGSSFTRAWKGYEFDILDSLEQKGYISGSRKSKSVRLTDEGIKEGQKLISKYLKR
ncbi:MAG: transposase [Patescibacteria group bacterium]|nr:transposase [Patescibacteria group bacterium]